MLLRRIISAHSANISSERFGDERARNVVSRHTHTPTHRHSLCDRLCVIQWQCKERRNKPANHLGARSHRRWCGERKREKEGGGKCPFTNSVEKVCVCVCHRTGGGIDHVEWNTTRTRVRDALSSTATTRIRTSNYRIYRHTHTHTKNTTDVYKQQQQNILRTVCVCVCVRT